MGVWGLLIYMAAQDHTPIPIKAKTTEALVLAIKRFQAMQFGRCKVLTIVQDVKTGEWVAWVYPIKNHGTVAL